MNGAQRRAATEQHQLAIAAINEMFDKVDALAAARDRLTGLTPLGPGDDPVHDAETLLEHATLLGAALCQLRSAAVVASAHRRRSDLATDIGTRPTILFPRSARSADVAEPIVAGPSPAHDESDGDGVAEAG